MVGQSCFKGTGAIIWLFALPNQDWNHSRYLTTTERIKLWAMCISLGHNTHNGWGGCLRSAKFNSNIIWNMRLIYHLHHDLHIHRTNLISHFGNHNQMYYGLLHLLPRYNSSNVNVRKYMVTVMSIPMQLQCVKQITEYSTPQGFETVYHEVSHSVTHLSQIVSGFDSVCGMKH